MRINSNNAGSILIISTWILIILSLLAIGLSFRSSLELKVAGYHMRSSKALYAAKGALILAIGEKGREYMEGKSLDIDALSEGWSQNEKKFKEIKLGDCKATVQYQFVDAKAKKAVIFYGMQDERSRININKASMETVKSIIG